MVNDFDVIFSYYNIIFLFNRTKWKEGKYFPRLFQEKVESMFVILCDLKIIIIIYENYPIILSLLIEGWMKLSFMNTTWVYKHAFLRCPSHLSSSLDRVTTVRSTSLFLPMTSNSTFHNLVFLSQLCFVNKPPYKL